MKLCFQGKFTILDSLVNALAVRNNVLPAKTVFEARAGALAVLRRMFWWGVSRSATSPERVGCGLARDTPGRIVHEARKRAGRERVFPLREKSFGPAVGRSSRLAP